MIANWQKILKPWAKAGWKWGVDGRFRLIDVQQPHETPWLHNPHHIEGSREKGLDCGIVTMFHKAMGCQAVHSFCHDCYKVVVVLETKEQVHQIADYQNIEMVERGWACKVGAELRPYTQRKWGAYWYCRGPEQGRERYKVIRKWVDENIGEHIRVFLKRGCTEFEFEDACGASDTWEIRPNQEELEKEFHEIIDYTPFEGPQAPAIRIGVWEKWDEWDRQVQDPVTYHEEGE